MMMHDGGGGDDDGNNIRRQALACASRACAVAGSCIHTKSQQSGFYIANTPLQPANSEYAGPVWLMLAFMDTEEWLIAPLASSDATSNHNRHTHTHAHTPPPRTLCRLRAPLAGACWRPSTQRSG
eukprot:1157932-Pelagomonas_calceolata.AAC.4